MDGATDLECGFDDSSVNRGMDCWYKCTQVLAEHMAATDVMRSVALVRKKKTENMEKNEPKYLAFGHVQTALAAYLLG